MAYKAEVIADTSGKWCGNALVFATADEATGYVFGLACRWTAVRETRVVACDDRVNSRFVDGRTEEVK